MLPQQLLSSQVLIIQLILQARPIYTVTAGQYGMKLQNMVSMSAPSVLAQQIQNFLKKKELKHLHGQCLL